MDDQERAFIESRQVKIKELQLVSGQLYKNCYIDLLAAQIQGYIVIKPYKAVPIEEKEEQHYINCSAIARITIAPQEEKKLYSALL